MEPGKEVDNKKDKTLDTKVDDLKNTITRFKELGYTSDLEIEKIIKNLENSSFAERTLTTDIFEYFEKYIKAVFDSDTKESHKKKIAELVLDFLKGGHIVFEDENAALYEKWKKLKDRSPKNLVSRKNSSSHKSIDEQFAVRGGFVKEALFGTTKKTDGKKHTWVQLESHSTSLRYLIQHMFSYFIYKITGKNIGPYGKSKHTEQKYLLLLQSPEDFIKTLDQKEELAQNKIIEHIRFMAKHRITAGVLENLNKFCEKNINNKEITIWSFIYQNLGSIFKFVLFMIVHPKIALKVLSFFKQPNIDYTKLVSKIVNDSEIVNVFVKAGNGTFLNNLTQMLQKHGAFSESVKDLLDIVKKLTNTNVIRNLSTLFENNEKRAKFSALIYSIMSLTETKDFAGKEKILIENILTILKHINDLPEIKNIIHEAAPLILEILKKNFEQKNENDVYVLNSLGQTLVNLKLIKVKKDGAKNQQLELDTTVLEQVFNTLLANKDHNVINLLTAIADELSRNPKNLGSFAEFIGFLISPKKEEDKSDIALQEKEQPQPPEQQKTFDIIWKLFAPVVSNLLKDRNAFGKLSAAVLGIIGDSKELFTQTIDRAKNIENIILFISKIIVLPEFKDVLINDIALSLQNNKDYLVEENKTKLSAIGNLLVNTGLVYVNPSKTNQGELILDTKLLDGVFDIIIKSKGMGLLVDFANDINNSSEKYHIFIEFILTLVRQQEQVNPAKTQHKPTKNQPLPPTLEEQLARTALDQQEFEKQKQDLAQVALVEKLTKEQQNKMNFLQNKIKESQQKLQKLERQKKQQELDTKQNLEKHIKLVSELLNNQNCIEPLKMLVRNIIRNPQEKMLLDMFSGKFSNLLYTNWHNWNNDLSRSKIITVLRIMYPEFLNTLLHTVNVTYLGGGRKGWFMEHVGSALANYVTKPDLSKVIDLSNMEFTGEEISRLISGIADKQKKPIFEVIKLIKFDNTKIISSVKDKELLTLLKNPNIKGLDYLENAQQAEALIKEKETNNEELIKESSKRSGIPEWQKKLQSSNQEEPKIVKK